MPPGLQRQHAVMPLPRRSIPHHDIAVRQGHTHRGVAALQPAKQENGRQAQRHRDDGLIEIAFIAILVQA
jgi:hypothetical protein